MATLAAQPGLAVPVSEQTVWAQDSRSGGSVVAVYSSSAGTTLDYPLAVLTSNPGKRLAAHQMVAELTAAEGQKFLQDNGFRDPAGLAGAALGAVAGVNAQFAIGSHTVPTTTVVQQAVARVDVSNEPSRLLAVMDVSGSMAQIVPGAAGQTRLDLAQQAAIRGLSLYPADSAIGLWEFSRDLTATTDYQELVPVGPLSDIVGGKNGQQRIAQALTAVQVNPDGGTGLYDTTLAAVRRLRATWDPHRVNTVLLLSDGQNDDAGSISLADLVRTLRQENDPARPIAVVAIAFGPDSDVAAMTQITAATGGMTYVSKDPRDIGEIFLDSVGRRLCQSQC